jgi:hypothetical protein
VNRKSLGVVLVALCVTYFAGCSSNPKHVGISITTAPPASLAPGGMAQVAATETGTTASIDWTCTPGNSASTCGSFSVTPTTSGQATTYTAPPTSVGQVTITATSEAKGAPFATAGVNIQANQGIAGNFAFYMTGLDSAQDIYSLAGAILINADGTLTGEQDFNSASGGGNGSTFLDDQITSGNLSVGANGVGTLTLVSTAVGTEIFTVNFVNNSHALIIESDGSTASGSLDLQTLPSTLTGSYAFALSGVGNSGEGVAIGGVLTINGTAIAGTFDENDAINGPTPDNTFSGATLGAVVDTFGRGTIMNGPFGASTVFYTINQNAIRLVDMDTTDSAGGSAFSQGAGTFSNSSLGNSVFIDQGNFAESFLYAAVGQIVPSAGNFTGVADVNEQGTGLTPSFLDAASISGTYTIGIDGINGYGSLSIGMVNGAAGGLMDVSEFGIYMVDPSVNVNDPNNSVGGGGALIIDLSTNVLGIGSLVPQTTGSFTGNYALGLQDFFPGGSVTNPPVNSGEADFVGSAIAGANLAGSGTISDPREVLNNAMVDSVTFSAPITADSSNAGRFTISPFTVTLSNGAGATVPYAANVYQASSGQLFWIEDGADTLSSVFGGQIQATSTLGAGAVKKVKTP